MTCLVSEFINRFTIARTFVLWTHSKSNSVCLGHKTYFIEGRQLYSPYNNDNCLTPSNPINLRLIISPAASPQSVLSCNHSPLPLSPRGDDRLGHRKDSRNFLSPSAFYFRTKASSLPSILDSDTELDEKSKGFPDANDSSSKSPTSVGEFFFVPIYLKLYYRLQCQLIGRI